MKTSTFFKRNRDTRGELERELIRAIQQGDAERVSRCLKRGIPANWQDKEGCSALFYAVLNRRWHVVDVLLAAGVSIDLADRYGWTPLFWAAFNGHVVAALTRRGANRNVRTHEGDWPLYLAVFRGYFDVVVLLL